MSKRLIDSPCNDFCYYFYSSGHQFLFVHRSNTLYCTTPHSDPPKKVSGYVMRNGPTEGMLRSDARNYVARHKLEPRWYPGQRKRKESAQ